MRLPVQTPDGPSATGTHRLLGRGITALAILLLLQTLGLIIGQEQWTARWWEAVLLWVLLAVFVSFVSASVQGRFLRTTAALLCALVLAGLFLWPVAVPPEVPPGVGTPWLWAVISVGAAWCTFVAGTAPGCVYALAIGAVFAAVRTTPLIGSVRMIPAAEDTVFATFLAVTTCLTIGILRQAAAKVDEAARDAIRQYGEAASATALNNERLRLDGLLHDSVMTALITAANAHSAYEYGASSRLAGRARRRLGRLDVVDSENPPATVAELAARIRFAAGARDTEVVVTCDATQNVMLPTPVVSALCEATTEAVKNAARHSGAARCEVTVVGRCHLNANRVAVQIKDNGKGFDQSLVSDRRLGIRVSIIGRLHSVGGAGKVTSAPGFGTEVNLEWEGAAS